jgi:tetratricopeptide (TPR) repeat protein
LVLVVFSDQTPDLDGLLPQAEAAFQAGLDSDESAERARGHFRRAEQFYERLRSQGIENANLYCNLGNAALLAGDLPQAILAYRRGLSIAPRDPVLRANLSYARTQVDTPAASKVESAWLLLPRTTAEFMWSLGLLYMLYISCCFFLARWWLSRQDMDLSAFLGSAVIGLPLFLVICSTSWQAEQERLHPIVIIEKDSTYLRKGNGFAYPRVDETALNRGVEARLMSARNEWLKIQLASGGSGWVPEKATLR